MKKTLNYNTAVTVLTPDQVQDLADRIASSAVSRALQSVSADIKALMKATRHARGILDQQAACELFKCNEDTIRRYRKEGLKVYRVGQQPFYLMDDIIEYVRAHPEAAEGTDLQLD